jgi:septal ring factor EnvC (AmiA/AmiB activator)
VASLPPTHAATKEGCQQELARLEQLIAAKEAELEGVARQLREAAQQQAQLSGELQQKERRLQALYDKQGRSAQVCTACQAPVVTRYTPALMLAPVCDL